MKDKKINDKPVYEIEYKNGEAYIDIPENEITEFIQKRLIEIANNERLLSKYRDDLKDMLEDELEKYAQQQFYETGRGKVYTNDATDELTEEDMKFLKKGKTFIEFKKLHIHGWGNMSRPASQYEPAEYEDIDIEEDFVAEFNNLDLLDELYDIIPYEISKKEIVDNWDKLIEENYDDLVVRLENDAKEQMAKEYNIEK